MKQEIEVILKLTLTASTEYNKEDYSNAITKILNEELDMLTSPIIRNLDKTEVLNIREEAEIYGNE